MTVATKTESKTNQKTTASQYYYGVGRRKNATARVKYIPSNQNLEVKVNNKPINQYFASYYADTINNALSAVSVSTGSFDLFINGGGTMGQAEAARVAISKALLKYDAGYRPVLRLHGFLTTDNRKVLPKRPGLRKSRKREQWSKR